jgi:hypothetical protein
MRHQVAANVFGLPVIASGNGEQQEMWQWTPPMCCASTTVHKCWSFSGRLVLFKTISKQEYEIRSDLHAVPDDLSLSQASDFTISRILRLPAPEIQHIGEAAQQELRPE